MKPTHAPSLPRAMPLARAAREILALDTHEVYRLAREGRIPGAFKVGKLWFVSVVTMIRGMQGRGSTTPRSAVDLRTLRAKPNATPEPDPDEDFWKSFG